MSRYFVILGAMRTGSNLLETTLAQLPELVCLGEAFNPAFPGKPANKDLLGWTVERRDADPLGFLEVIRSTSQGQIPGFRLFEGHCEPILEHVLTDPDCARIVLTRDPLDSYVSLKIAEKTRQWILRVVEKRVSARVRFEPEEFEDFAAGRAAYYQGLRQRAQAAGQTLFTVDYTELKYHAMIAGVARHIGATYVPERFTETIARQNPGPVEDKLENPEDLAAWQGRPHGTETRPREERATYPLGEIRFARNVPLGFAPIPGAGVDAGLAALERIDRHGHEPGAGPAETVREREEAEVLFLTSSNPDELAALRAGRRLFTLACHPLRRAYRQFMQQTFPGRDCVGWVRAALEAEFGKLKALKAVAEGRVERDIARHRALFDAFLGLVEAGRREEGPYLPAWDPQTRLIGALGRRVMLDRICRLEDFVHEMRFVSMTIGEPPQPVRPLQLIRQAMEPPVYPLEEMQDEALADRVRELYAVDFEALGYEILPDPARSPE